jgi:hypothetical protein
MLAARIHPAVIVLKYVRMGYQSGAIVNPGKKSVESLGICGNFTYNSL